MKAMITTKIDQVAQAANNFLLRYHSAAALDANNFSPRAKHCLRRNGMSPEFFTSFTNHHALPFGSKRSPSIANDAKDALLHFVQNNFVPKDNRTYRRVARVVRHNVALMSVPGKYILHKGKKNVKRNDTYILVNEEIFGQIEELFEIQPDNAIVVILRKFEKTELLDLQNKVVILPLNHYPYKTTPNLFTFQLKRDVIIQKGIHCVIRYKMKNAAFPCLSFRANDQFSF